MVQIINQNILDIKSGIICHQVNCQKVMGGGVALAIKNKWPHVFKEYQKVDGKFGMVQVVSAGQGVRVANVFAQNLDTIPGTNGRRTDYDALRTGLKKVNSYAFLAKQKRGTDLYIPYMIGCGLGGGDWEKVLDIILEETPNAILCRYQP